METAEAKIRSRDNRGNLVFNDDREVSLAGFIEAATEEFPGVPFDELSFEQSFYGPSEWQILLGRQGTSKFREHDDSYACKIYPYPSLAQVIRQAESLPGTDFKKVRLFWFNCELCMTIAK